MAFPLVRTIQAVPGAVDNGSSEGNVFCHFSCRHCRSATDENVLCGEYREFLRHTAGRFRALGERLARAGGLQNG